MGLVCSAPTLAHAAIVELDATVHYMGGVSGPILEAFAQSLSLAAGIYHITPLDIPGSEKAWNPFGTEENCVGSVGPCDKGWTGDYGYGTHATGKQFSSPSTGFWANADLAFDQVQSSLLELPEATTVFFWLPDGTQLGNEGGMTLQVTPVPIPGALVLMLSALAGLVLAATRRVRGS